MVPAERRLCTNLPLGDLCFVAGARTGTLLEAGSRRWLSRARRREWPPLCLTLRAGDGGGSTTYTGGRWKEPERTNARLS